MRILGFQKIDWHNYESGQESKLLSPTFSSWRFPRKDRDLEIGERVQIVIKPCLPIRVPLGEAIITSRESRPTYSITSDEARKDGFILTSDLDIFLLRERIARKLSSMTNPNKLMLHWLVWYEPMIIYANSRNEAYKLYKGLCPEKDK